MSPNEILRFSCPVSLRDAIDEMAKQQYMTRSQAIRRCIYLQLRGNRDGKEE